MAAAEEGDESKLMEEDEFRSMDESERGIIDSLRELLKKMKIPKMSDDLDKTSSVTSNNYDDFGDLMKEIAETLLPAKKTKKVKTRKKLKCKRQP